MEFELKIIEDITNKFSEEQKVGSGGYADVYRGFYNGEEIAVKRLHNSAALTNKEFENELLNIRKVQHENVVKLVGFCGQSSKTIFKDRGQDRVVDVRERILCFEFMHGGALDQHIADHSCDLDWPTCYKIIKGICAGINHLHTACGKPIWHLDLKPANILLDNNKNAKIADLGLSRLATHTLVTKNAKGTQGYMPPEYVINNCMTEKNDVYSLGVLILNVMDGKMAMTNLNEKRAPGQFVNHVCRNWNKRLKEKPGHPSHKIESLQVKKCVELALKCVQWDRHARPCTKEVVHELEQLDAEINKKLSLASDDDQIGQVLDALALNSSIEDLSQLPSTEELLVSAISGPRQLDVVILYAFDCSISTTAWRTVDDGIFWMVHKNLTNYFDCCMGYIYFMMDGNTYTSDMKPVNREENKGTGYKAFSRRRVACTENMACGLGEAHEMISNRGYQNGIILLFSDGLKHKGDFFDGAEEFKSEVPVHTFTLGGAEYNEGLRAIAENSPGGKFHTIPVPERPMLSKRFPLLLHSIFGGTTFKDEESPSPSSETQPLDVVLVYAFDCTKSTLAWGKMDASIFWMVQERLTSLEDSCMGYIYPMLNPNNYTSDMKLVDLEETKATGYTAFDWRRLPCTKNMASGLAEARKMLSNRGNQNGIILFFSDGLRNKGDFFDGTDNFKSEVPVHTFTLGRAAYNQGLQAIADNSRGGRFHPIPVPDRPELSLHFSEILDSLLGIKTN